MSVDFTQHPSSYRDPSGFIFEKDGVLYRQVNTSFKEHFEHFVNSGCYDHFVKKELLIPHKVIGVNLTGSSDWHATLQPEKIDFISYPYEWSFDMLKDAALLTLQLLKESISFGLVLKDATPYNIQWHNGKFIFIDTLSFEKYDESQPWVAYRQFCENFLCPLLLMHYSKNSLHQLFLAYPDGIPLAIAKSLLPWRSKFSFHAYLHIHLHAGMSAKSKQKSVDKPINFSKQKLLNLVSSLEILIKKTKSPPPASIWHEYYSEASQRNDYLDQKRKIITEWVKEVSPNISTAIDFGANEGEFSKITAGYHIKTIATDFAADCINTLYIDIKSKKEKNIHPLIIDLSAPSPANGVLNTERASFIKRADAGLGFALALIHHLAIGKNIPFEKIADFFSRTCSHLIIEWVPKDDEKVKYMLEQKTDVYTAYLEGNFVNAFERNFSIASKKPVHNSKRILYLMKRK